jgi:hypothetical protein
LGQAGRIPLEAGIRSRPEAHELGLGAPYVGSRQPEVATHGSTESRR